MTPSPKIPQYVLTLELLKSAMAEVNAKVDWDSFPSAILVPPRFRMPKEVVELQRNINLIYSTGIEVIESKWLPRHTAHLVLRSQYKTRLGFKRALRYWRKWNRDQERAMQNTFYFIGRRMSQRADETFADVLSGYKGRVFRSSGSLITQTTNPPR
jgi:hypothetical protein